MDLFIFGKGHFKTNRNNKKGEIIVIKYILGTVIGGLLGYFILYRVIGCSSGGCPLTSNSYTATIIGIILGLLVASLFAPSAKPKNPDTRANQTGKYMRITAEEAKERMDSGDELVILDVRTEGEYEQEHIPNSILIPNETINQKMPDLLPDLDAEILIYCRSGNRSAKAAKKLIKIGYTNVFDFGGIIT